MTHTDCKANPIDRVVVSSFPPDGDWCLHSFHGQMYGTLNECVSEMMKFRVMEPFKPYEERIRRICTKKGYISISGYSVFYDTASHESSTAISGNDSNRQGISKSTRYDLLKQAGFKCQACGISASEAPLEIDHIIPISRNGLDSAENYQVLCKSCNTSKSNRVYEGGES